MFKQKYGALEFDVTDWNESQIVNQFVDFMKFLDNHFINKSIPTKNAKSKLPLSGGYKDSDNNMIDAPILNGCTFRFAGKNNQIIIDKDNKELKNIQVEILGNNNILKIGRQVKLKGTIRLGHNCSITIGNQVSSTNTVYITCAEATSITIGDDCMFATNNQIRTDDAHAIYDVHTGKRVNKSASISIGEHVWVGYGAVILGGTTIGSGSIVGMNALLKKRYPNNCVIVGSPAKVVRKDVFWERPNVLYSAEEKSYSADDLALLSYCIKSRSFCHNLAHFLS